MHDVCCSIREREGEKPPVASWLLLFVVMLPPSFSLILPSMCVQSIFNQPIYRAYAKIAQQQQNKMSREAPSLLLKLIHSMCDAIDNDRCLYCCCRIYRHIYMHKVTICRINDNTDYTPHPSNHPSFIFLISPWFVYTNLYSIRWHIYIYACV